MFIFLKLILAHLIADFILQFEELYQLKVRSFIGQWLHALVHGLVSLVILYPYLNEPQIWIFVGGMVVIHLAQDLIKYSATKKNPANTFFYFMLDQLCHVGVIAAIFFLPISHEIRGFPDAPFLNALYQNRYLTIDMIFFITLTFAGSYILSAFAKSYLGEYPPLFLITSPEMFHAIIERSLVVLVLISGWPLASLLLIPCLGILRLPFKPLRNWTAYLLSLNYAILVTVLFHKAL